jgi:hypothetical protein
MKISKLTWALCCYTLLVSINWWKKWIHHVEIMFDSNENIEWHCMQLELNCIGDYGVENKSMKIHCSLLLYLIIN